MYKSFNDYSNEVESFIEKFRHNFGISPSSEDSAHIKLMKNFLFHKILKAGCIMDQNQKFRLDQQFSEMKMKLNRVESQLSDKKEDLLKEKEKSLGMLSSKDEERTKDKSQIIILEQKLKDLEYEHSKTSSKGNVWKQKEEEMEKEIKALSFKLIEKDADLKSLETELKFAETGFEKEKALIQQSMDFKTQEIGHLNDLIKS